MILPEATVRTIFKIPFLEIELLADKLRMPETKTLDVKTKVIVERDGEYCVTSEDGSRNFGCYSSKGQAEERLRQIEWFKLHAKVKIDGEWVNASVKFKEDVP